jgi:cation diffusion facilitator family transporter
MAERESKKVVRVGLIANVVVAISKYVAGALTGSSSMLAEAFHSTADSGNELLLLLGMKRCSRPPDKLHPYGYGKALYFYSLLVAVYIFGVGAVLAVYHGISRLQKPQLPDHPGWNYGVLAIAACLDFYSWRVSYRELRARKDPDESLWDEIIGSKDPTIFIVFLEDSAGLLGVFLAFLGVFLGHAWNNPYLDPIASIAIGLVLAGVALILGRETGALLIGERTNRSKMKKVEEIINEDPSVEKVGDLLTMQLGPDQVLLTVQIRFRQDLDMPGLEGAIDRIEKRIREEEPEIQRIFIEAESFRHGSEESRKAA